MTDVLERLKAEVGLRKDDPSCVLLLVDAITEIEMLRAEIIGQKNVNEISFRELKQEIKNGLRP